MPERGHVLTEIKKQREMRSNCNGSCCAGRPPGTRFPRMEARSTYISSSHIEWRVAKESPLLFPNRQIQRKGPPQKGGLKQRWRKRKIMRHCCGKKPKNAEITCLHSGIHPALSANDRNVLARREKEEDEEEGTFWLHFFRFSPSACACFDEHENRAFSHVPSTQVGLGRGAKKGAMQQPNLFLLR